MGQICTNELRKGDSKLDEIRKSLDQQALQHESSIELIRLRLSARPQDREEIGQRLQSIQEEENEDDVCKNPFSINLFIKTKKEPSLISRKTIAHIGHLGGPGQSVKTKELVLRNLKKQQERMRKNKEIEENFQALASGLFSGEAAYLNPYNKDSEETIVHTIRLLSQMNNVNCDYIKRYGFKEIRQFLAHYNWDEKTVARKIYQDIHWRNANMPIENETLVKVLASETVLLQGNDKDLVPCCYIRPNSKKSKFSEDLNMDDYQSYFIYLLDTVVVLLMKLYRFTEKLSFIVDLEFGDFRLDLLELLEDLFQNHFPGRLTKIFIVKINLDTINESIQQTFQQEFYQQHILLMDDTYKLNLLRFFDPVQLRKEYGGEVAKFKMFNAVQDKDQIEEYIFNQFIIM